MSLAQGVTLKKLRVTKQGLRKYKFDLRERSAEENIKDEKSEIEDRKKI